MNIFIVYVKMRQRIQLGLILREGGREREGKERKGKGGREMKLICVLLEFIFRIRLFKNKISEFCLIYFQAVLPHADQYATIIFLQSCPTLQLSFNPVSIKLIPIDQIDHPITFPPIPHPLPFKLIPISPIKLPKTIPHIINPIPIISLPISPYKFPSPHSSIVDKLAMIYITVAEFSVTYSIHSFIYYLADVDISVF